MEATHQSALSTNLFPANGFVRHTEAGFEKYSVCVCVCVCVGYVNVFCTADINLIDSLQQFLETNAVSMLKMQKSNLSLN